MGMLGMLRIMSMQRGRKRNREHVEAHNESIAPLAKRNGSPSRKDDTNSQGDQSVGCSRPDLPEDIWRHIHSLLPMRHSARVACVSRIFLHSWRRRADLTFSREMILCSKPNSFKGKAAFNDIRDYNNKIEHVLSNHSGVGVKTFSLHFCGPYNAKSYDRLSTWLQIAVTPGIEELTLQLSPEKPKYNFPCSLLSGRRGDSIRYLLLNSCVLRPTIELGLRSLTILELYEVCITEDELGCILSNSFALEKLMLIYSNDIIRLEIPCVLKSLSYLEVFGCSGLQVIENKAINISTFRFSGDQVQLSLEEFLQVKMMQLNYKRAIRYFIDNIPSVVPNLETLTISSSHEMVDAPIVHSKFLRLKFLSIRLAGTNSNQNYDYLSLASFLEASPWLETFDLHIYWQVEYDMVVGDHSYLRQMPGYKVDNLKTVKITGFCSTTSLVELTCHILENAASLECLTLDTTGGARQCSDNVNGNSYMCWHLTRSDITAANRAVLDVGKYIEGKVPPAVNLNVLGPCSRCHACCNLYNIRLLQHTLPSWIRCCKFDSFGGTFPYMAPVTNGY